MKSFCHFGVVDLLDQVVDFGIEQQTQVLFVWDAPRIIIDRIKFVLKAVSIILYRWSVHKGLLLRIRVNDSGIFVPLRNGRFLTPVIYLVR